MARDITSGFQTEIEAQQLRPILLFKGEFDSGTLRFWTGVGDLTFNAETYTGSGDLLSIEKVEETEELTANKVSFKLNGIPPSLISLALSEPYQGRVISAWFGVLDDSGSLISDPYKIFSGFMDVMTISDTGNESLIAVDSESELITLRESKERRYTPEDQKSFFSGDKGLDFVPLIQDIELAFGAGRTD